MDWTSLFGPAVVAAGVSGFISIVSMIISARAALQLHSDKLQFDQEQTQRKIESDISLAERKFQADQDLAERKLSFDKLIAERKFRYDTDLHDHQRRVELAEQALTAVHEAKGALRFALIPARFDVEYSTRKSQAEESIIQQNNRDFYFLPIQRLIPYDELFSKFYSLSFAFIAHFGEAAGEPFEEIFRVHQEIITSAKILVDTVPGGEDEYQNWSHMNEPLRSTLGWGPVVQNRDKL